MFKKEKAIRVYYRKLVCVRVFIKAESFISHAWKSVNNVKRSRGSDITSLFSNMEENILKNELKV